MGKLYKFNHIFKETIWGGTRILPYKGLPADDRKIGESWELSGVPGSESIVWGGEYDGYTLSQLVDAEQSALVGEENYARFGNQFPLLIKFIDASQPLSLQVHPDDALANERHACPGKNEMWYVVSHEPGASLINGFKEEITFEEYERRVSEQSLPEVMHRCEVRTGDVFYLPAGRVHGIGAGCFICEIQQTSDITYRIYDYGRMDAAGQPRQLHIDEAKAAINFTPNHDGQIPQAIENEPVELVNTPYFCTSIYRLTEPMTCDYSELDSFVVLICTKGKCSVTCSGETVMLHEGNTLLVAATAETVALQPDGECDILETYV